jgi:hypothetical protein
MPGSGGDAITQLRAGQEAPYAFVLLVYSELQRIAGAYMRRERPGAHLRIAITAKSG